MCIEALNVFLLMTSQYFLSLLLALINKAVDLRLNLDEMLIFHFMLTFKRTLEMLTFHFDISRKMIHSLFF